MSATVSETTDSAWPAIMTWRAPVSPRLESVRIMVSGSRIRANGRIVAGATEASPAFSASYDLVTDELGATKRLTVSITLAARERQLSLARDDENMWLVQDHRGQSRGAFGGACDADMVFSPFFNALPIRRLGITGDSEPVDVPVLYVTLPDFAVRPETVTYRGEADRTIAVASPFGNNAITVDDGGFVVNYPGLAERL